MTSRMTSLTMKREKLLEYITYDPALGLFRSTKDMPGICNNGDIRPVVMKKPNSKSNEQPAVRVAGAWRRASHVAYILMTGRFVPPGMGIFFKDGDKSNLRWDNLVLADQKCGGKI